jgi:hypothetical protein
MFGTATLVAGSVSGIAAGCLTNPDLCTIILSRNTPGGTLGFLSAPVAARGAGIVTFTISSSNVADVSTVNWLAIPKNIGMAASSTFVNNASLKRSPSGLFVVRGSATLVAGAAVVSTGQSFSTDARVFCMAHEAGGTTGKLSTPVASVNPATGQFTINSDSGTDTSTIDYIVVDKPLRFSPSGIKMSQSKGSLGSGTATFNDMLPLLQTDVSVLASVITPSTPGNLRCPNVGRAPTLTDGTIIIASSDVSDASLIEVALF